MSNIRTFTSYTPHKNQLKYHQSTARERIIISSIRAGKTFGLIHDIIVKAWNIEPHEANMIPLPVILVCAPTYSQVRDLLFDPIKALATRTGLYKRSSSMLSGMQIELLNGRIIVFRTLGANSAETIRGITAAHAYVDECALCTQSAINTVRGRLMTTQGSLSLSTTPKGKSNWLYQDYFSSTAKVPVGTEIFHYNIYDNPVISSDAVEHLKSIYPPKLYEQEVEGKFVSLDTSCIYYEF
ncbi:phage terminase large subunit, partial [Candidatus Saccharibacteria bacterium]|nr:phage terminase large subunit [Candidatus Saccharibacteria bacterium]